MTRKITELPNNEKCDELLGFFITLNAIFEAIHRLFKIFFRECGAYAV